MFDLSNFSDAFSSSFDCLAVKKVGLVAFNPTDRHYYVTHRGLTDLRTAISTIFKFSRQLNCVSLLARTSVSSWLVPQFTVDFYCWI